jgi:hypothetical protein
LAPPPTPGTCSVVSTVWRSSPLSEEELSELPECVLSERLVRRAERGVSPCLSSLKDAVHVSAAAHSVLDASVPPVTRAAVHWAPTASTRTLIRLQGGAAFARGEKGLAFARGAETLTLGADQGNIPRARPSVCRLLRHDVARWFRRVLGGRDGCGCGRRRAAAIPWCGLSHGYKQAFSMADQCTHRGGDQRARRLCAAALCDRYDASFEPPAQGDARRLNAVLGGPRLPIRNGYRITGYSPFALVVGMRVRWMRSGDEILAILVHFCKQNRRSADARVPHPHQPPSCACLECTSASSSLAQESSDLLDPI